MNLKYSQTQKLSQNMSYYMMRFMELFAMPTEELRLYLKHQVELNPFLDEEEDIIDEKNDTEEQDPGETTPEIDINSDQNNENEIDWEQYVNNMEDDYPSSSISTKEDSTSYEPAAQEGESLIDHLISQLNMTKCNETQHFLGELIIGNLNEEGFFPYSPNDILIMANNALTKDPELMINHDELNLENAKKILRMIQFFDPIGIATANYQEALLIQLEYYKEKDSLEYRIIQNYFDDLENKRYQVIAKQIGVSKEEVLEAEHRICLLDPKPGINFSFEIDHSVIPDIFVEMIDSKIVIYLNDSGMPRLKINPYYRQLLQNNDQSVKSSKIYLKERLNSAVWLIKAIEQRKSTIYRIAEKIVEKQPNFFYRGPEFLKPMTLKDIADEITVHPTTVGRIVNNKYMQTQYGVYNMKYFFSAKIKNYGTQEDHSARLVMERIKQLLEKEDRVNPYSDNQVVELLEKENVTVARRTITKYREKMGILPSRLRKKQ